MRVHQGVASAANHRSLGQRLTHGGLSCVALFLDYWQQPSDHGTPSAACLPLCIATCMQAYATQPQLPLLVSYLIEHLDWLFFIIFNATS